MRITQEAIFRRVMGGLSFNFDKMIRAQEQVSSGRRILRPSDDPVGTARALGFQRRIAGAERYLNAISSGLTLVDSGAGQLETGSGILTDARELLIQGMNGTLAQNDRESLASEIELLRSQMIEVANSRSADRYLFGGTLSGAPPWEDTTEGGLARVDYLGNDDEQQVRIGLGVEVSVNVAGTSIFAKDEFSALSTAGLTGLQAGGGAVMGDGFHYLELRHDSTDPGTIGSVGLALANGGADDTLLGSHPLVIDQAAGTVRLGSGPAVAYPQPGDPGIADFTVENEQGGTLRLDFSGFTGANFTGTVRGDGSISTDGTSFVPLDFTQSDLELVDPDTGNVMRLDATGVGASGKELVHYSGAVNVFDVLGGIAEDLRNGDGLDTSALVDRLGMWLGELDRNHDNLLVGLGALGSRSERMSKSELRLEGVRVQLSSMLSDVQDADFSEVVLDMSKAEQTLQLAQQTGMRLMQNNLLRFL